MPRMDGWAVLAVLKSDLELAHIPIIIVSIMDEKNLGFALGASDYITKPIDGERLTSVLDKFRSETRPCSVLVVGDNPDEF